MAWQSLTGFLLLQSDLFHVKEKLSFFLESEGKNWEEIGKGVELNHAICLSYTSKFSVLWPLSFMTFWMGQHSVRNVFPVCSYLTSIFESQQSVFRAHFYHWISWLKSQHFFLNKIYTVESWFTRNCRKCPNPFSRKLGNKKQARTYPFECQKLFVPFRVSFYHWQSKVWTQKAIWQLLDQERIQLLMTRFASNKSSIVKGSWFNHEAINECLAN